MHLRRSYLVAALALAVAALAPAIARAQAPGATLGSGGVTFKVWAPHATSAVVVGDFNGWSTTASPLANTNGWWSGFVAGARAGQQYQYVFNGNVWKPDPYGRAMVNDVSNSIIVDPNGFAWSDGGYSTPNFNNMIIYEAHVRSFVGKNDGQTYPGNFVNFTTKLDYLKSLGVNMIELMPAAEFPGDQSWGYNITGYFAPEDTYGTPDQLKSLVNEAHRRGMGVIMDVVYNHVGNAGNSGFLWNYDGDTEYGDGGIYFNNYNTAWGAAPDFGRWEVKQYFQDNAMMWLGEYHMDGLRWDATSVMKATSNGWNFMRDINWNVRQAYPNKILIAEQLPYDNAMMSGANFHSDWWVDFCHKLRAAFNAGGYADLNDVKAGINGGGASYASWRTVYAVSHDEAANGSQYNVSMFGGRNDWDARAKARAIGALNLMNIGIPMLLEGEEFLQDAWFSDNFAQAVNWSYQTDGVGSQALQMYKDAITVRWLNPALRGESLDYTHQDDGNKVLAFKRYSGSNVVLVVVNFSGQSFGNHAYGVSTGGQGGQWTQAFCSQDASYGGWDGACNAYWEPWTQGDGKIYVNVPKYSVVTFRLK